MASQVIERTVLVCQNRTCRKQGSAQVLQTFQSLPVPGVEIIPSQCLGRCGNGPMVVILPDQVRYCRVLPEEVATVVERHLRGGVPVPGMLDTKSDHQIL